jgi:RNA polymerase sigma-70 factor (ECF subfamily)
MDTVHSDEDLVQRYREGDESAYAELLKRHLQLVYTYVYRLVREPDASEDIAQETFVKAWKSLKNYDPKTSKFKTWLLRIARNSSIDYLRKKKHVPLSYFDTDEGTNVLAETVSSEEESVIEKLERQGDAQMVRSLVEKLHPKQQEVLLLYYAGDTTFEEIASVLNEPTNTIKSRHRRALAALKNLLAPAPVYDTYK